MLFPFLQKQKSDSKRRKLIETMITALHVSEEQKDLYIEAIQVLSWEDLEILYGKLTKFIEHIELKEVENIKKEDFSRIAWMRKKEAKERIEEVNSFSFLLNNL